MTGDGPPRRTRALVLTADIGEGHASAARALAEDLRRLGSVDVAVRDGIGAFGAVVGHVMREGYRWQLRWAPRSYDLMYRALTRVRVARAIGERILSAAGGRRLRRIVRRENPDVVISTHPALTCVLGRMRLRRRLDVPVCATVTDFDGYGFWSHRGADRHLVMHADALVAVERLRGAGSAALVRPLVAAPFLITEAPAAARAGSA
jgi:processive 1,2-diacylglycerol beta-glucosyltransferase